jgi:hypothetical protein
VTLMHARAVATPLVELEQWDAAAGVLDAGIRRIERFLEDYNQLDRAAQFGELKFLRQWKDEILEKCKSQPGAAALVPAQPDEQPADSIRALRAQLRQAILEERYEDAAHIRDMLDQRQREDRQDDDKWSSGASE